jgi:8-oxo-dGTP diphosphatase
MDNRPKVGVGVIIIKDKQVLLGRRKSAHGQGTWCFPGGHLEFHEELEACARREVLEETGLHLKNVRAETFTNDIFPDEGKHYITLYMRAEVASGQVAVAEPDKCEQWAWFAWDNLPEPLFIPIQNLLKQGYTPFGSGPAHSRQENTSPLRPAGL